MGRWSPGGHAVPGDAVTDRLDELVGDGVVDRGEDDEPVDAAGAGDHRQFGDGAGGIFEVGVGDRRGVLELSAIKDAQAGAGVADADGDEGERRVAGEFVYLA